MLSPRTILYAAVCPTPYPPSSSVAEAAKEEEEEARLPREIWENMAMAEEGEGEWGWQWEKTHTHSWKEGEKANINGTTYSAGGRARRERVYEDLGM